MVDGQLMKLLVHRKGSTRAFPPHHPLIPVDYQLTGQPVLIGGTMGTCSYVLTGTDRGLQETFGSTCHGAGACCTLHRECSLGVDMGCTAGASVCERLGHRCGLCTSAACVRNKSDHHAGFTPDKDPC